MTGLSRRQFVGLAGATAVAGLAGCTDAGGEEGEFLVVTEDLAPGEGSRYEGATENDIVARIGIENQRNERQRATLESELRYEPPNGETETWVKTEELDEGRGVSPTVVLVFEDVYDEGNDFEDYVIDSQIIEEESQTVNE